MKDYRFIIKKIMLKLRNVQTRKFCDRLECHRLDLSSLDLLYLPNDVFVGFEDVNVLLLNNNKLTKLDINVLSQLKTLKELNI